MDGMVGKLTIAKMAMGKPMDPVFPSPKFGAMDLKNPSWVKRTIFKKNAEFYFNIYIERGRDVINICISYYCFLSELYVVSAF
jgi:hypothetical protein